MRTAATLLGILGGTLGAVAGTGILILGASHNDLAVALGVVAVLLSIGGMVGGTLASNHRRAAVVLLLVPGVLGFLCVGPFWAVPGVLLLVGGVLKIAGGAKTENEFA